MSRFPTWVTATATVLTTVGVTAVYHNFTVNGNAKGSACVLPFTYKGNDYHTCVTLDHHTLWCSTTAEYDRDRLWGECLDKDVCLSPKMLSDPWRNIGFNATSFPDWPMNDLKLQEGWYQFSGIGGDILDDTCTANRSGTNLSYSITSCKSLNGNLHNCELLQTTSTGCSFTKRSLLRAACTGGLFIYYLFPTREVFSTKHSSCSTSSCGEHAHCNLDGSCVCDAGLYMPDGLLPTGDSYGCTNAHTSVTTPFTLFTTAIASDVTTVPNIKVSEACQVWAKKNQPTEAHITADICFKNLSSQIDDITAKELPENVVEKVLEVFISAAHQNLSNESTDKDELVSSLNIMLNRTKKLASKLVKTTQTNYSLSISLPDIEIRVFAVGPNSSLRKSPLMNTGDAEMEIDLIGMSKNEANKGHAAVTFVSYTNITSVLNRSFFNKTKVEQTLMSAVVSVTLPGTINTMLTKPVNFTLKHTQINPERKPSCVYWRETEWVVHGCRLISTNISLSVCSCVHLSTFALIMQTSPAQSDRLLDLLYTVTVPIGLVFLSLALLTFALFHGNPRVTNPALINLCISLLLAHLLLLLTQCFLEYIQPLHRVCAVLAGMLHFLFLSAFVWMLIDAVLLFVTVKSLSKIRSKQKEDLIKKFLIVIGYGSSLVVVGVSAGLVPNGYGSDKCWLKEARGFIWSFLGPVCFILACNTILFILIIINIRVTLTRLNSNVSQIKQMRTIVFKTMAQSVILGCPWILGPFTSSSKVVEILFLVLNSQQGTFIFLIHCVFNQEVRQQYRKLFGVLFTSSESTTTEVPMT